MEGWLELESARRSDRQIRRIDPFRQSYAQTAVVVDEVEKNFDTY